MSNLYGKESKLNIETEFKNGRTILNGVYFSAPLKISPPFYTQDTSGIKVCLMNVSPGIFERDFYDININMKESTTMELYSQSYTKLFRMDKEGAAQKVAISLEKGATLKYIPHPTIPYEDSKFTNVIEARLKENSLFIYRDIIACGRYKRGEIFRFSKYVSKIKVYVEDKLIFLENTHLEPSEQDLTGTGFYEGYTHQASVYYFGRVIDEDLKKRIEDLLKDFSDIDYGITKTHNKVLVIKILGKGSESLRGITDEITSVLSVE